nr:unnamed protein product [Callosobruchus analis]
MTGAPDGSVAFGQENGWMTSEIFCKRLKHFHLMKIGSFYYWMATVAIKVSMLCSFPKKMVLLFFVSLSIVLITFNHWTLDSFVLSIHILIKRSNYGFVKTQFKIASLLNQAY